MKCLLVITLDFIKRLESAADSDVPQFTKFIFSRCEAYELQQAFGSDMPISSMKAFIEESKKNALHFFADAQKNLKAHEAALKP